MWWRNNYSQNGPHCTITIDSIVLLFNNDCNQYENFPILRKTEKENLISQNLIDGDWRSVVYIKKKQI